jgi:hypothetical protein
MRRAPVLASAAGLSLALGTAVVVVRQRPAEVAATELRPVLRLEYAGGSELAYDGRHVYAGQFNGRTERDEIRSQGGVRIVDAAATPPRLVGTIRCPGTDMDVAVPRAGLLAVGYHRSSCGVGGNGVTLFDVSDPARPRQLGSVNVERAHTLTALPGTPYVYVSPGGLRGGKGLTSVVDTSDPERPRVARTFAPDEWGCHDVTFAGGLGVCAGGGGVRLWDMADPLRPRQVARVDNPDVQFAHGAAVSDDGGLLVVNDEAYARHGCGPGSGPDGSLHLYDVSRPSAPRYLGRIGPPRGRLSRGGGRDVATWCTSHQLNFVPGTRRLVNAWFTGGVSVWDLAGEQPREVASYQPAGAIAWTAHWFGGRVWVNDMSRGLEALELTGSSRGEPAATWIPAARISFAPGARRTPPAAARLLCPVPGTEPG